MISDGPRSPLSVVVQRRQFPGHGFRPRLSFVLALRRRWPTKRRRAARPD